MEVVDKSSKKPIVPFISEVNELGGVTILFNATMDTDFKFLEERRMLFE